LWNLCRFGKKNSRLILATDCSCIKALEYRNLKSENGRPTRGKIAVKDEEERKIVSFVKSPTSIHTSILGLPSLEYRSDIFQGKRTPLASSKNQCYFDSALDLTPIELPLCQRRDLDLAEGSI
jgi:hypothetical protein